ncbi:stage II sporulation protein R [Peribacillus asahii]|uniref:stage II sporulation protein R n=1 Tax=Peribacillus asahii TaxID=228899 RepID=UPI00207AC781|nr:stage II sporulation protein R [Peribacillus asahii]USK59680.1 stage II sporulation protein R [Peribacillus asahii]
MKKRNLAIIYLLILTIGTIISLYIPKQETAQADTMVIPDEAIRLRILANSDREADQAVKRLIRDEVNKDITEWVAELTSLEEARKVITSHLDDIQATAERVVAEEGLDQSVQVDFGQAEFPTKLYGQYLYPAGDYEAVIITLGEGDGANWWCVLFPPLCFLDFSNGTAVSQTPFEEEEVPAEPVSVQPTETENSQVEENKTDTNVEEIVEEQEEQQQIAPKTAAESQPVHDEEEPQQEEPAQKVVTANQSVYDEEEPQQEEPAQKVVTASQPVYDGEEEPKIVEKSLFAELFSKVF